MNIKTLKIKKFKKNTTLSLQRGWYSGFFVFGYCFGERTILEVLNELKESEELGLPVFIALPGFTGNFLPTKTNRKKIHKEKKFTKKKIHKGKIHKGKYF